MELTIIHYLVICPLVFLAGFMDAIAGGGGLISLPAYMLSGVPVHLALGTNKLSAVFGASISAWRYTKKGYTPGKISLFCVGVALLGSSLGAQLALRLDDRYFKLIMLVLLPITAFYVLKEKAFDDTKPPLPERKTILICMAISLGVGVYDGFYGPGSGTFLLILLTSFAHLKLRNANGVAKIINWATNVAAVSVYIFSGNVYFPLGIIAGLFNIMGSYLGTVCFEKGGAKIVKPTMIAVVVLFFIKVITEQGIFG
ncbi:MAG: sulfite exporter TauE/SafE family protein [Eubacteriales bacterium]|nr:sulfite exporter TauE/SafE family protein [Eubacteriales bacterium]